MDIGTHETISIQCKHKCGSVQEGMTWCALGYDASKCEYCQHKNNGVLRETTTFVNL